MPSIDPRKESLAAFVNKRIRVRGTLKRWDRWSDAVNYREFPTCCISNVEHEGELVAEHVWVHHAQAIKDHNAFLDQPIEFDALVLSYRKAIEGGALQSYFLDSPDNIRVPEPPPALHIPDLRATEVASSEPKVEPLPAPPIPDLHATEVAPTEPKVKPSTPLVFSYDEALSHGTLVKETARTVGGFAKLRQWIDLLEN